MLHISLLRCGFTSAAAHNPQFLSGLKLLVEAGLVFETANPDAGLLAAVVEISDRVPDLRIVLDHHPHAEIPVDAVARTSYQAPLRELTQKPQIFVKGSEIIRRADNRADGRVILDAGYYKDSLDQLWEQFGEDRIFFGSDWPTVIPSLPSTRPSK